MKPVLSFPTTPQTSQASSSKTEESGGVVKRITPKDFDDRRAKGLCFGCDEKYFRGHICKKKQLFMIDIEDDEEEFVEDKQEMAPDDVKRSSISQYMPHQVAKRAGVQIQPTNPLTIIVADGTKISSKALVKNLQWTMQGTDFTSEVRLLPLGGCDMVLGVQWLSTLGPVLWDFKNLQIQFSVFGKKLTLTGDLATDVRLVDAKKMQHLLNKQSPGMLAQLCSIQAVPSKVVHPDLLQLLHTFDDVFMEPKGLPPFRSHDHQIPLKPEHLHHVSLTLAKLREHQLFAKMSKCAFGQQQVEYVGHVITCQGVAADPAKIDSMLSWPRPPSIKVLRGFLGLTGYYRRFIKDNGKICQPLNMLLRKDAFGWSEVADLAFINLQTAMSTTPVLTLPNYTKPFVLECDASGTGVGAVLMQEGRPIAYYSKTVSH
ncbi:hypothetical protein RHSIM_Rhsim06G0107000 [Rhododendron simsii]|uniref:Reverse transcriptase/retrotransposon-derived protein RNase H-like domain-containing protein n=1 Tax=Rhododendron simsii TaxID=118357 RepID=A0A834LL37_RHOSS|nr:hypothetical protein RHSIM_Rhsim06G0107000 [Rhododendron simsii]